jgi:hypothetical protein
MVGKKKRKRTKKQEKETGRSQQSKLVKALQCLVVFKVRASSDSRFLRGSLSGWWWRGGGGADFVFIVYIIL